jgi:hypothetical protein
MAPRGPVFIGGPAAEHLVVLLSRHRRNHPAVSDLVARGRFVWAQKHGDRPARHRVVDMDWQEAALLDDTVDGSW